MSNFSLFEIRRDVKAPWVTPVMWEETVYPYAIDVGLFRNALRIRPDGISELLWNVLYSLGPGTGPDAEPMVLYTKKVTARDDMDFTAILPKRAVSLMQDCWDENSFLEWDVPKNQAKVLQGFFVCYIQPGVPACQYLPESIQRKHRQYGLSQVRFQPGSAKTFPRALIRQISTRGIDKYYAVSLKKLRLVSQMHAPLSCV